jgi:hypothetical protein
MSGFSSPETRFVCLFCWGMSGLGDPAVSYTTVSSIPSFKIFFCVPKRPDWLWLSPSFLVNGCPGHLPGTKRPGHEADQSPPFPRLRRSRSPPPHPHVCNWRLGWWNLLAVNIRGRNKRRLFLSLGCRCGEGTGNFVSLKRWECGADYAPFCTKCRTGRHYFYQAKAQGTASHLSRKSDKTTG